MKSGATRADVNQIKLGYKKGMTAEAMSQILQVPVNVVENFHPDNVKRKTKTPDFALPDPIENDFKLEADPDAPPDFSLEDDEDAERTDRSAD